MEGLRASRARARASAWRSEDGNWKKGSWTSPSWRSSGGRRNGTRHDQSQQSLPAALTLIARLGMLPMEPASLVIGSEKDAAREIKGRGPSSRSSPRTRRAGGPAGRLRERGDPSRCQCQRFRMLPGSRGRRSDAEELAFRLREQADCGHPSRTRRAASSPTSGATRSAGARSRRAALTHACSARPASLGRPSEDKDDGERLGGDLLRRPRGLPRTQDHQALARAAVDFARERGARALEGYPMLTKPGDDDQPGASSTSATGASSTRPGSRRSAIRPRAGSSCASTLADPASVDERLT